MRILIVEDDKDLCDAVVFQLTNEGYAVDMCHDGLLRQKPQANL